MNILVIGDVMLDKYITGTVDRISPEAPVPVLRVLNEENRLGGAANVANNIVSLEQPCSLIGFIGADSNGQTLANLLVEKKINNLLFESTEVETITKIRVVAHYQQIVRMDYENTIINSDLFLEKLIDLLSLNSYSIIVLSDYNKGVCTSGVCEYLTKYCGENNIHLIIDPKGKNWSKYQNAWLVTPNLKELQDVSSEKVENINSCVEGIGLKVMKKFNLKNLLVTRSEQGMTLISDDKCYHFGAVAQQVFDVSGAGDTVIASLAVGLSNGRSLKDSVEASNLAAGYVVSKFGTYAICKNELDNLVLGK